MPTLALLPYLPDAPCRRATTLAQALRGDKRRALLLLGGEAELAQAVGHLGTEARDLWHRHRQAQGTGPLVAAIVSGKRAAHLFVRPLVAEASAFEALTQAGRLVQATQGLAVDEVVLWGADDTAREALWSAWVASRYTLPVLGSKSPGVRPAKTTLPERKSLAASPVAVPVGLALGALQKWQAVERGAALARWLTALPGNHLTPALYRKRVEVLARQQGWKVAVSNEAALRRAGAGAFLAVAQGNSAADACLIRLQYQPAARKAGPARSHPRSPVALVGKGVCFDTGGVNLKPHRSMLDMHTDMAGSAVALGTLLALTELRHPEPVDAWLALAENHLAAQAYKPQDVVVASNGTTIQVIHTDAEGRMLLADALALASRTQPRALVDFATLTGACIGALTERYAGLFTNRPGQRETLEAIGRACGERVWGFPLDADFDTELESKTADIIQCPVEGKGDHIYAARFLQRFVGEGLPWVHLDLAPATRHGGLAHISTDITGFGVRYATTLLQDESALQALAGQTSARPPRTFARTP